MEISRSSTGAVKIEKVTCAVDCGVPVNPDVILTQMESGIGHGIGHVMRNEITFTDGVVDQNTFPNYLPLRINDIAQIETHIVPSSKVPTGADLPPAGPALANAIADSGLCITHLPMDKNGVVFV